MSMRPNHTETDLPWKDLRARYALSAREAEVAQMLVQGFSSKQIAFSLSLSRSTVRTYTNRLYQKLNVKGIAQLVMMLIDHGNRSDND